MARAESTSLPLETVARIKELHAKGLTRAVIQERLQLTKSAVCYHLEPSFTRGPAWSDDRVEALKIYWADGLSASQIAKKLGSVTRSAVIGKVHRLGLIRSPALHRQALVEGQRLRSVDVERRTRVKPAVVPSAAKVVTVEPPRVLAPTVNPAPKPLRELAATWAPSDPVPMGEQGRLRCAWPIETPDGMLACNEARAGRWCAAHAQIGKVNPPPHKPRDPGLTAGIGTFTPRFIARRGGYE